MTRRARWYLDAANYLACALSGVLIALYWPMPWSLGEAVALSILFVLGVPVGGVLGAVLLRVHAIVMPEVDDPPWKNVRALILTRAENPYLLGLSSLITGGSWALVALLTGRIPLAIVGVGEALAGVEGAWVLGAFHRRLSKGQAAGR